MTDYQGDWFRENNIEPHMSKDIKMQSWNLWVFLLFYAFWKELFESAHYLYTLSSNFLIKEKFLLELPSE